MTSIESQITSYAPPKLTMEDFVSHLFNDLGIYHLDHRLVAFLMKACSNPHEATIDGEELSRQLINTVGTLKHDTDTTENPLWVETVERGFKCFGHLYDGLIDERRDHCLSDLLENNLIITGRCFKSWHSSSCTNAWAFMSDRLKIKEHAKFATMCYNAYLRYVQL